MNIENRPTFRRIKGSTSYLALEHSNLGLYVYKKRGVLIDSGYTEENANWIAELLESEAIQLEAIINTHAHPDNSGGSSYLKKRMGCKVYATATQRPFLENPSRSNYLAMVQAVVDKEKEESESLRRKALLKAENIKSESAEASADSETENASPETEANTANPDEKEVKVDPELTFIENDHKRSVIKPKPCQIDGTLDSKKPFTMSSGKQLQIVDLSGHVMGMCGVITPDDVFFIGDSLYTFDELSDKPIPYLESVEMFKKTLDFLLASTYSNFVPTHGKPLEFSINSEVLFHQRQIEMIEEAILLHLQMPRVREELVALLFATFGIEQTIPNFYMMSSTIVSFLNHLKRERRIAIIHEDGKTRWFTKQK
jgi:glyoxylase-like metal-dependent hydrolase (beta-lactamase superfamily II)